MQTKVFQQRTSSPKQKTSQQKGQAAIRDNRPEASLQRQLNEAIQQKTEEEEKKLQGKFIQQNKTEEEEKKLQGKFIQRTGNQEEEKIQPKAIQKTPNKTGMPDSLKSGVEQLSGLDMSDVRVHYNSANPASVQAHAYTQGTDIHVAPGQEQHLAHEAWHVAQQKQGRVQATTEVAGMLVNDNPGLEQEADTMGAKAIQMSSTNQPIDKAPNNTISSIQRYSYSKGSTQNVTVKGKKGNCVFEECTYNSVEYKKGESLINGSGTSGTANWANWVKRGDGKNNATRLHVVNSRWGGLGGNNDGNIFPGSPAENSHHLHEAEKEFDKCFTGKKADNDCKYECKVTPSYTSPVDVTGGDVPKNDANVDVTITNAGVKTPLATVSLGNGLLFKDGS